MREIKFPDPINVVDPDKGQVVFVQHFSKWLTRMLTDQGWGRSLSDLYMSVDIKKRLENSTNNLLLEEQEWDKLCQVLRNPASNYVVVLEQQLLPFFEAVLQAPKYLEESTE